MAAKALVAAIPREALRANTPTKTPTSIDKRVIKMMIQTRAEVLRAQHLLEV